MAAVACLAALAAVPIMAQAPGPVAPQVTGWLSSVTVPADVVVVVDESAGLTGGELTQVRNLVRTFIGSQEVGAAVQMALVGFGATAREISALSSSTPALQTATSSILSSGPDRCLECGISMADQILTMTGRPGVAHLIVAISRGTSTAGLGALAATAAQAQVGATIIAIGLDGFDQSELDTIASPAVVQTVFTKPDVAAATDVAGPLSVSVAGILDELPLAADATCDTPATLDLELQGYNTTTQAPIDIVLVLDESGSIDAGEFSQLRQFAVDVVNSFTFGATATQVGIVMFSNNARTILALTPIKNSALNAIGSIVQRGGTTCIPCGLQNAISVFNGPQGNRANVNRFVILLTDGVNNVNTNDLPSISAATKALPSTIIGLGVGNGVDLIQLQNVVSVIPGVQTLFLPQSFGSLTPVIETLVALISAPAVQNVNVTVDLAPPFEFAGAPLATAGSVANTADSATWTLGSLGADLQRLRMAIQTTGRQGGTHQAVAGVTYTDNDGNILSFGNATYNIRGCPAVVSLDPPTATNYVDETHTVTATVLDDFNDPVSGEAVDFAVSAGPNAGASGSASTDASGQASFTWSNAGGPGTDTVDASLPNAPAVTAAHADKLWRLRNEPPVADAGTDETVNLSGSPQAAVTLDGTGSTDDGEIQPLSYSWSEGATPLGSGATLAVSLPIGVHTITLIVDDGELSDSDEVVITVVDPTPPVVTPDVSGPAGNAGWYVDDVNVSWTVSDPESDVTSETGCDPSVVSSDTAGATFTCEATSAGGTTSATTTVKRDATPPAVDATPDRGPDVGAWYNHPLTVSFTGTDALSGVVSCDPAAVYAGPDASAAAVSGGCADEAGNSASASYGFAYDATAPSLAPIVSPNPATLGGTATASANASDATSGVAAASCGPVVTTTVGTFQVACTATDHAGNTATVSTPYAVGYALCTLYDTEQENRSGSTIPMRVQLCDATGAAVPAAGITITAVAVNPGGLPAEDSGKANPGGLFRMAGGAFMFNLKTTGLPSGSYGLEVSVSGDPATHLLPFVIR